MTASSHDSHGHSHGSADSSGHGHGAAPGATVHLRIRRQDGPGATPRWEDFRIQRRPNMNVITALLDIARNPVTAQGRKTTPVQWECSCLEEVCGSCTMKINGRPRQSCSTLIDQLEEPVELEPLSKFPVIRDLAVDRRWMFDNLKRVKAWVPLQGTYHLGEGPRVEPRVQDVAYNISRCMTCACCVEACPQVNARGNFIGPAAVAQVRLFNLHPTGANLAGDRLDAMMDDGGVHACGNAQNCVQVCPKEIHLTEAIADVCRQVTVHAAKKFFGGL